MPLHVEPLSKAPNADPRIQRDCKVHNSSVNRIDKSELHLKILLKKTRLFKNMLYEIKKTTNCPFTMLLNFYSLTANRICAKIAKCSSGDI